MSLIIGFCPAGGGTGTQPGDVDYFPFAQAHTIVCTPQQDLNAGFSATWELDHWPYELPDHTLDPHWSPQLWWKTIDALVQLPSGPAAQNFGPGPLSWPVCGGGWTMNVTHDSNSRFQDEQFTAPLLQCHAFSLETTFRGPTGEALRHRYLGSIEFPFNPIGGLIVIQISPLRWAFHLQDSVEFPPPIQLGSALLLMFGLRVSSPSQFDDFARYKIELKRQ